MSKDTWTISGYDGADKLFEDPITVENFSEQEMRTLLQRLASRHLSDEEIVSSSLHRNAKGYTSHLEVTPTNGKKKGLMTNGGCHYVANIENE